MIDGSRLISDCKIIVEGSTDNLSPGDYVLVTRWNDCSLCDPWAVGVLARIDNIEGTPLYCVHGIGRYYKCCKRILPEEGARILEIVKESERFNVFTI
jgi:hypothetical protein